MKRTIVLSVTVLAGAAAFADIRAVTPVPCAGKDWWMPRHEAKLAEIQAASTNGGIKVAFLGDSITHFWEGRPASRSHWSRTFGRNSPYKALNLGFSGDRTENLLLVRLFSLCQGSPVDLSPLRATIFGRLHDDPVR